MPRPALLLSFLRSFYTVCIHFILYGFYAAFAVVPLVRGALTLAVDAVVGSKYSLVFFGTVICRYKLPDI